MSTGDDPVTASAVNIVGRVIDDAVILRQKKGALKIRLDKET